MNGEDFAARVASSGTVLGLSAGMAIPDFDSVLNIGFIEERLSDKRGPGLLRRDYGLFEAVFSVSDPMSRCESIIVEFNRLCTDQGLAEEYAPFVGGTLPKIVKWDRVEKCLVDLAPPHSWTLQGHDDTFAVYGFPDSMVLAHVLLEDDQDGPRSTARGRLWSLEILSPAFWQSALKTVSSTAHVAG